MKLTFISKLSLLIAFVVETFCLWHTVSCTSVFLSSTRKALFNMYLYCTYVSLTCSCAIASHPCRIGIKETIFKVYVQSQIHLQNAEDFPRLNVVLSLHPNGFNSLGTKVGLEATGLYVPLAVASEFAFAFALLNGCRDFESDGGLHFLAEPLVPARSADEQPLGPGRHQP